MIYLSKLLDQKVWDAFGHVVGKLDDLLVDYTDQAMPPITALAIRVGSPEPKLVDSKDIATLWPSITLNVDISRLDIFQPAGHELYLKQRVLDQQIVDRRQAPGAGERPANCPQKQPFLSNRCRRGRNGIAAPPGA